MKSICFYKLLNALRYQRKTLTMNDAFNSRLGTDFFHWCIVRKVRTIHKKDISISDVKSWLEGI